jgi:hypothetical protein
MSVPCYPDFAPVDLAVRNSLHPRLSLTADGVSEFTFSGLYLFRRRYTYRISQDGPNGGFIISGEQPKGHGSPGGGTRFFLTPCGVPAPDTLKALFKTHDYWKNISESVLAPAREGLERQGLVITEDRDNFDYLYLRSDLAELSGKKYHKKKNLVNQFLHAYPEHESRPLTADMVPQAMEILERWLQDKAGKTPAAGGEDGDYVAAREALELFDTLALRGRIYFVDGKPAAYCLGESIAKGRMFAIHFEKAIEEYKGVYQFMNQEFAAALPRFFIHINREQDLGEEGLRQAKMTYRPSGFVKKYTAVLNNSGAAV